MVLLEGGTVEGALEVLEDLSFFVDYGAFLYLGGDVFNFYGCDERSDERKESQEER